MKFLRLSEDEAHLVVRAVNASRLSTYKPQDRVQVSQLVQKLGRFLVASAEELRAEVKEEARVRKGAWAMDDPRS